MDNSKRTMQELWDHHGQAVAGRNLEAFLEDFAHDCVFITPQRIYRGRKEIAEWFRNFVTMIEGAEFISDGPVFEQNVIFIKWDMESKTHSVKGATDTFVVKGGRFQILTVNIDAVSKGE